MVRQLEAKLRKIMAQRDTDTQLREDQASKIRDLENRLRAEANKVIDL